MSTRGRSRTEVPAPYLAHPFLDPLLPSRQPSVARLLVSTWRDLRADATAFARMVQFYTRPAGQEKSERRGLAGYFRDADSYLDDLLRLVPDDAARRLRPCAGTRSRNEIRALLETTFESRDRRERYEAQRKLYLAKLLFDIDHCRSVRDGMRHKSQWGSLLQQTLWAAAVEAEEEIEVPGDDARTWRFRVRRLSRGPADPPIEVYLYRSRFKRETEPAADVHTSEGRLVVEESPRWPALGRRSGSILSKMIRRGIGDPRMVQDLLGAMFIVGSRRQAYALERRLMPLLGGPLRCRDRVDTLGGERDRARLDPRSSSGFQVLKQIVDVLMPDPAGDTPYLFPVEVQIYPVEAYLHTLHDVHFASHTAYKRRQFLHDLLPVLFPDEIFGTLEVEEAALVRGAG